MGLFRSKKYESEDARRKASIKRLDDALLNYRLGKINKKQLQEKIKKEHKDKYK